MKIIDASVAFKWFIPEVTSPQALALLDGEGRFHAPELILTEVANAMWVRLRNQGEGQAAVVAHATRALQDILDRLVPPADLLPRAIDLAFALRHPVYDCVYLALAEREGVSLVTADNRLIEAAQAGGLESLVEALA